jgi:cytochrome c peroxidase
MTRRLLAISLVVIAGCRAARPVGAPAAPREEPWEAESPLRPLPAPPLGITADLAAIGVTPEKVRLGRWLFFDPRLSADGTVSCGSCHRPEHAFSEPRPVSTGVGGRQGTRRSPPIVNAAFPVLPAFFWDGRAGSLAEQAKGPLENPVEMASTHDRVVATVAGIAGYRKHFRAAYGDDGVDLDRITGAIAAYEATRLSGNSAFDRFDAGDESALSDLAKEGREVFFGPGRCNACHLGQSFTDSRFHNVGVGYRFSVAPDPRSSFADLGRAAITGDPADAGKFKTPTLRDLKRRAPYMHDGSLWTLEEVVFFYVRGGNHNPWIAPELAEQRLGGWHVAPLVAFLESLEGEGFADTPPTSFPR